MDTFPKRASGSLGASLDYGTPRPSMSPPGRSSNTGSPVVSGAGSSGKRREHRMQQSESESLAGSRHSITSNVGGRDSFTGDLSLSNSRRSSRDSGTPRKPEDTFRDEIAKQIFGEIGAIRDDFSCAVESKILLHGRMYITEKFICFYSNFFGFEKKIKIPFSHVLRITKGNTALLIPNGINVVTSRKEYCFRSFWDRDECYFQLVNNIRAYRHLPPETREAVYDSRSVDKDGTLERSSFAQEKPVAPSQPVSVSVQVWKGEGVREDKPSPPQSKRMSKQSVTEVPETEALADGYGLESHTSISEEEVLDFDDLIEGTQMVSTDLRHAFEKALTQQPLKDKGFDFRLKCSVQKFFDEFVSDRAPCGLDKYHEVQGDKVLEISPWQEVSEGVGATRMLRFETMLKDLPVGPSSAPLLKLQRVRVFGRHGMILETSSSMEKVPAADCFTVEDRWIVKADGASEGSPGSGSVLMQTSFETKFIKSTLLKRIIENRSKSDELSFHQRWYDMAQAHLSAGSPEKSPARRQSSSSTAASAAPAPRVNAVVAVLRRMSEPVAVAATTTVSTVNKIKWKRLVVAVLAFTCLFYLLRLLLRALLPPPEPLPLHDVIKELRALRAEVKELRQAIDDWQPFDRRAERRLDQGAWCPA